jgi:hypothetical protein
MVKGASQEPLALRERGRGEGGAICDKSAAKTVFISQPDEPDGTPGSSGFTPFGTSLTPTLSRRARERFFLG